MKGREAGNVHDTYTITDEVIGKGTFGEVRRCWDVHTGQEFCCKTCCKELFSSEQLAVFRHEAEVMMHLRGHPNIVTIMGIFEDDDHIHIIQELCTGGNLFAKLSSSGRPCSTKQAAAIMQTILGVLSHCHTMGVLYRDVKLDNFLLSSDSPCTELKATDFGISKFMQAGELCDEFCGTPMYMAPEVFDMQYGFPADVWSAGIMMYYMLAGEFPFRGKTEMELGMKVCCSEPSFAGAAWSTVPSPAKELVKLMLTKDPATRPTASQLLQHKFFCSEGAQQEQAIESTIVKRMRGFAHMNQFKKQVMGIIANSLELEYTAGLLAMFRAMDSDKDGYLTADDVATSLQQQGCQLDTQETQRLVHGMDTNHDGRIDITEFTTALLNRSLLEKKDLLLTAFKHFDMDDDGFISREELLAGLPHVDSEQLELELGLPGNGLEQDGSISFQQFVAMMLEECQEHRRSKRRSWLKQLVRSTSSKLHVEVEGCSIM